MDDVRMNDARSTRRTLLLAAGGVLVSPALLAAAGPDGREAARAHALAAMVDGAARRGAFQGVVRVTRGERVLFERSAGDADAEWHVPNGPSTRFRLGSLTKQFTAAAVLVLAERGKLSLDEPVTRYLPEYAGRYDQVTLAQLLGHTSGIPNFTELPAYAQFKLTPHKAAETVALVKDLPLDFAPGQRFKYSNTGYVLLGQVIEAVSGQSYGAFLESALLARAGMRDTAVDETTRVVFSRAQGYAGDGPGHLRHADFIDMSVPGAAGSLASTAPDLQRWQAALYGGRLLSSASLQRMTTPGLEDYALGLVVERVGGEVRYRHAGNVDGFSSALLYRPASGVGVIVLSNVEGTGADWLATCIDALVEGPSPYTSSPFFLQGSFSDWKPVHRFASAAQGRWVVTVPLPAGKTELKIGSANFSPLDLGSASPVTMRAGQGVALKPQGENLTLEAAQAGSWRFELDVRDPFDPVLTARPAVSRP